MSISAWPVRKGERVCDAQWVGRGTWFPRQHFDMGRWTECGRVTLPKRPNKLAESSFLLTESDVAYILLLAILYPIVLYSG